MKGVNTSPL